MKLILNNFRCFSGEHSIKIAPLTFLVGENSSGKTAVLSAFATVMNGILFPLRTAFNQIPYDLGDYDTIANMLSKREGRSKSFSVGFERDGNSIVGVYTRGLHSEIRLHEVKFYNSIDQILIRFLKEGKISIALRFKENNRLIKQNIRIARDPSDYLDDSSWYFMSLRRIIETKLISVKAKKNTKERMTKLLYTMEHEKNVVSMSPIRTKPSRIYDIVTDEYDPEGGHIPAELRKLDSVSSKSAKLDSILNSIRKFGADSGLFTDVKVRRIGNKYSNPFQIFVKHKGIERNLMDMGYGVSQVLPLLFQSITESDEDYYCIQQPEVHLHPKAQAALGTFLVEIFKVRGKNFIIETHSDFMIDRVRLAVAEGLLQPKDVSIIFMSSNERSVAPHRILLDEYGNIHNAPPDYRKFFLAEELEILSRTRNVFDN